MKMTHFLDKLKAKNISVYLKDGKVKVKGNQNILTDDFLAELKARKAEIIEHLSNPKTETESKKPTWFDLCGKCKSVLYESKGQWFCPTNCR